MADSVSADRSMEPPKFVLSADAASAVEAGEYWS